MKKSVLFILSLVILLSSVLTVMVSATDSDLADDMFDDDMNVTYDNGTTATTSAGLLGNLGGMGDGVGDLVGGVVESVFQDNDISQQVGDKVNGIVGIFDNFDLGGLIPTTKTATTGSNFFDPINPVVTGSYTPTPNYNQNTTVGTPITSLNGDSVDFNTTVNPYTKPTAALNPGDKGDGVKWLQWILIYTECGLQGTVTGDYDDATAAAVKNLQLKYGLTVDGIASLEVIEKAEQMYNDYVNGVSAGGTSSSAVINTVGSASNSTDDKKPQQSLDVKITIIIVILVIVWIFAIAAVIIIVHIKRKGIKLNEDGEIVKTEKPEKEKSQKKAKKSKAKGSKRAGGNLRDFEPLRESKTLRELEDDSIESTEDNNPAEENESYEAESFKDNVEFEVVDIVDDFDDDDDGEIILSSLSEMKKRKAFKEAEEASKTNE